MIERVYHVGNVRVTIGDRKLSTLDGNNVPIDFAVDVLTTGQYFPFGMARPNQMYVKPQHEMYRFGYNGMERELGSGLFGNTYSTMFRSLETRMGRWWSPDPIVHPWESPYASMGNNPISFTDPLGLNAAAIIGAMGKVIDAASGWLFGDMDTGINGAINDAADWLSRQVSGVGITLYEVLDFQGGIPDYTYSKPWDTQWGPYDLSARFLVGANGEEKYVGLVASRELNGVYRAEYYITPGQEQAFFQQLNEYALGAKDVYEASMSYGSDGGHLAPTSLYLLSGQYSKASDALSESSWVGDQWTFENVFYNALAAGEGFVALQGRGPLTRAATNGGVCFVAGTQILTSDGHKNIEDIEVGDEVWAYDEQTGEERVRQAVQTFRRETNRLVRIEVSGEEIITTPEHPFYVSGQWEAAGELRDGDKVRVYGSQELPVLSVSFIDTSFVAVYNFEVDELHSYFVSEGNILVHNLCFKGKWGRSFRYRAHPHPFTALDHIWDRHSFSTSHQNVSKFAKWFGKLEIKELVQTAIEKANSVTDLRIKPRTGYKDVLYDFGYTIGLDVYGNKTSKIMIHLDDVDNVRTAYPVEMSRTH